MLTGYAARANNWALLGTLVFLLLVHLAWGDWRANSQDRSAELQAGISAGIDGRKFVGTLKAKGDSVPDNDAFSFKDGKFVSEGRLKWGFSPAPYWVRRDKDGLHFLSE